MRVFMDGPSLADVANNWHRVDGFTTNPSLVRKLGINNYEAFCREILHAAMGKPVSIEVLADDTNEMIRQGLKINEWAEGGGEAWIKIPVTNTSAAHTEGVIGALISEGCRVNITAVLTMRQIMRLADLYRDRPHRVIVSVFAGRIADTGRDPFPMMQTASTILGSTPVLWASTREIYNHAQACASGCSIITMPLEMIDKMSRMHGQSLAQLSLETVAMFHRDGQQAGYVI